MSRTNFNQPTEIEPRRTHKDIKTKETAYNPITQKFNDQGKESMMQTAERENFVKVIAQNKVTT